jgi:hypothetical protein
MERDLPSQTSESERWSSKSLRISYCTSWTAVVALRSSLVIAAIHRPMFTRDFSIIEELRVSPASPSSKSTTSADHEPKFANTAGCPQRYILYNAYISR